MHSAEYPVPEKTLLHLGDTHLTAPGKRLFDLVDGTERLARALTVFAASGIKPEAIVFTGDLADLGEPAAYAALRGMVEPFAEQMGARVLWVMGNHDERGAFRKGLLDEAADLRPVVTVDPDSSREVRVLVTVPADVHLDKSQPVTITASDLFAGEVVRAEDHFMAP